MKNSRMLWAGAVLIVLVIIALGFSVSPRTKESKEGPIKIGVATILSGDFASLGVNIVNTAKLAANDINKQGGINGQQVEIVAEDAGCDSKGGLNAIQKLVNTDGIKYIIGGMCSNGTLAAAPIANQQKALILTPVTGGSNVDKAGPYIFRIANSDVLAGQNLAQSMVKLGYKRVAVVAAVTDYTVDIQGTFEQTIKDNGAQVVASEQFPPHTTDYRTLITKVKGTHPDAILVLSQLGTDAAYFIKQSKELGLNEPIFTDFTLATNGNVNNILGSLDGIYFADPDYDASSPETKKIFQEYQDTYDISPAVPFHAASTYDGVMLLAQAIRAEGDNSEKVQKWLSTEVKNYNGLMGTYSLDAEGNSDLGFVVRVIKNGKPADIKY
jgi:branched-chain amino acid transport system substrate-binding protein